MNKFVITATTSIMLLASVQAAEETNPAPSTPPSVQRQGPGAGLSVNANGTNLTVAGNQSGFGRNNAMMWAAGQSQEVELVQISATFSTADGGDKKGLARWAELEGEGYKIAHVVTSGSQMFVFLERPIQRFGQSEEVRLPDVVEQDKALAASVREKIKAEQTTRAETRMKQMPQWERRADGPAPGSSPAPGGSPAQTPPKTTPGF